MDNHRINIKKRIANLIIITVFIAGTFLPLLDQAFHLDPTIANNEKRKLSEFPKFLIEKKALEGFTKKFEDYYNDNFGFRNTLIRWNILTKVRLLGSLTNSRILMGKDNWLFYKGGNTIEYYRSTDPFTNEQLTRWQQVLEERRDWLAKRGIKYLFIAVPTKHIIYPEFLPDSINRVRNETRLDQLIAYLHANSNIRILDLRNAILEAKNINRLYYRTDTHWNEIGAFIAYEHIMKYISRWFPKAHPLPMSEFNIQTNVTPGKDLAKMLGIQDIIYEKNFKLVPNSPMKANVFQLFGHASLLKQIFQQHDMKVKFPENEIKPGFLILNKNKNVNELLNIPDLNLFMIMGTDTSFHPKAVMFHDSYTVFSLFYFMSNHFKRIVFIWCGRPNINPANTFETSLINRESPDIVIQEMGERLLMKDIPTNPVEIRKKTHNKI